MTYRIYPGISTTDPIDPDTVEKVVEACAFLIPIAEQSAKFHNWNPGIVDWLDRLGSTAYERLQKSRQ